MFEEGYTTSFNLVGYHAVDGLVEVVPEEVELVRRIFRLYLEGYGKQAIANILFEEGVPSCLGGEWSATTVHSILQNEKYIGDLLLQKTYITDHITKASKKNNGELPQVCIQASGFTTTFTQLMVQLFPLLGAASICAQPMQTSLPLTAIGCI